MSRTRHAGHVHGRKCGYSSNSYQDGQRVPSAQVMLISCRISFHQILPIFPPSVIQQQKTVRLRMQRNSFKMRKSLGRGQKENVPQILNNVERDPSLVTLPSLHFPCATLNLRPDPSKKTKRLPLLDAQKSRTSRSTQHLSNPLRILPTSSIAPSTKSSIKLLASKAPLYQVNELQNKKIVKEYGSNYLKLLVSNSNPCESLENHNIKFSMRAKMVDWMIEVLSSYKCSDRTFFQSVELMDTYYQRTLKVEDSKDLHLLGVCCMFMIIKLEEIIPLRLQTVYEKIGHKKLSMDTLKKKEEEIFSCLGFNIILPTVYDIMTVAIQLWGSQGKLPEKDTQSIIGYCVHMAKMVVIQYQLVSVFSKTLLSGSMIFLSFKLFRELNLKFDIDSQMCKVLEILGLQKEETESCAAKVLDLVRNFDSYYPSLGNCKKFSKFGGSNKKASLF